MTLRDDRGRSLCEVLGHQAPWSRVPRPRPLLRPARGQGRPAEPGRPTSCSAPSIGTSASVGRAPRAPGRDDGRARRRARGDGAPAVKSAEDERAGARGPGPLRRPDRPPRRRAPGTRAGERAVTASETRQVRGRPLRHRAPRGGEQPPRARPRELRPAAGRAAADLRPPLGRGPPLRGRAFHVDGRARGRRPVRGAC